MSKILLIIGPSGVGKSSAVKQIEQNDNLMTFKLDDIIKEQNSQSSISKYFSEIGNEAFCKKSIEAIRELENRNPGKSLLIDVGAGSFDWEGSLELFLEYKIVTLTGDKNILYERIKSRESEQRSLDQYVMSEFMPHKALLYEKSSFNIDTSKLSIQEVANEIKKLIDEF